MLRCLVGAALAGVLIGASAGCGSGPAPEASTASATGRDESHGAADEAFARSMIPHHRQAVALAALVPARTANAELRMLANHIGSDQQAEIRTLDGLLDRWGRAAEEMPHEHPMPMAGMVDPATMDRLGALDGEAFDTLWVTSMIDHHRGAVAMAQDEVSHGQDPDAIRVAEQMIVAQQREIAMLTHLISASR